MRDLAVSLGMPINSAISFTINSSISQMIVRIEKKINKNRFIYLTK
jgi:hypothetical protein